MERPKLLLIGVGRWGVNHLRILHSLPIELYVAESDDGRLQQAQKLGLPQTHLFTHYQDITAQVDAAVVVTPAASHYALCREFLDAGKDVLVEKPIALRSEQARELAELADQRNCILQVGHIFKYDPASTWIKNLIDDGKTGDVRMMRGNFSGFKRPRMDTGVTFADAIHFVELFNYYMGRPPKRVNATLRDLMDRGMDDVSLITMDYETDTGTTWAIVESGYFSPGKLREVLIVGERLTVVCDYNMSQYKIHLHENRHVREAGVIVAQEGTTRQIEVPPEEPLLAEMTAFVGSIRSRKRPLADGWSAYHAVRVLEAAVHSSASGHLVELE